MGIRVAIIRGVLCGVTGIVVLPIFMALVANRPDGEHFLMSAFLGVIAGLAMFPVALVEAAAHRRPATWHRDLLAAGATLILSTLAVTVAFAQMLFTSQLAKGGSLAAGFSTLEQFAGWLREDLIIVLVFFLVPTLPFTFLAVARIRRLGFVSQLATSSLPSLILAAPALTYLTYLTPLGSTQVAGALVALLVLAIALPALYRLADALDDWIQSQRTAQS